MNALQYRDGFPIETAKLDNSQQNYCSRYDLQGARVQKTIERALWKFFQISDDILQIYQ
jgi:hypothetical protein